MNAKDTIRMALASADQIAMGYLEDFTDAELLTRPVPGANHIAWQLGHLVASEHGLMEAILPGSMPPLPAGFKEKYTNDTASGDKPEAFHTKAELLKSRAEQRAGTLKALESVSESDLDKPSPEQIRGYAATWGAVFLLQGTHTTMHAGQWAVSRRKLGRPPLF
ncbi:MAG: DinB family protein [Pirellulales bacterium]